jgi:uncharacterized membrane protein YedE/YeeE
MDVLFQPWPWYVSGPLIGLIVPILLLLGGKPFGLSANLQHMCAATVPAGLALFKYDWKRDGGWNLLFAAGIVIGGFVAARWLMPDAYIVGISDATREDLIALGLRDLTGVVPPELFGVDAIFTARGVVTLVVGGFLVGFGARWAGGCTSGHAISGLAALQPPSLLAVIGFFTGGLLMVHVILPFVL